MSNPEIPPGSDSLPENQNEKEAEYVPLRQEILYVINTYCNNPELTEEFSDDEGIYYLVTHRPGETPNRITECSYKRRGTFPDQDAAAETVIEFIYYVDGEARGGEIAAEYNREAKKWIKQE